MSTIEQSTRDERLADFRRRLQPHMDALRRAERVDPKVTFAFLRERLLEVDHLTPDERVDRLVRLAPLHHYVDDDWAVALYEEALRLAPELEQVRRRLQWLRGDVHRRRARAAEAAARTVASAPPLSQVRMGRRTR